MRYQRCLAATAAAIAIAAIAGCEASQPRESKKPPTSQPAATQNAAPPKANVVTGKSDDGRYTLSYSTRPEPLPLNEMFGIDVHVATAPRKADGPPGKITLTVDARMPEHQHGMNVEPKVEDIGNGDFRVSRMLFHMPGHWELYFDIAQDGVTTRVQFDVNLD